MSKIRNILFIVALIALTIRPAWADIVIGVAGPMTGGMAAFGEEIKQGTELAVEDINAQGGLLGQKVRLVVEDDACDPQQARNVATKMAAEKAFAVIGHWCSPASMPASEVYAEEGILELEPGALLSPLTHQGIQTLFRVSATDKLFAAAIASYTIKNNPGSRVAIVTNRVSVTLALTRYIQSFFASSSSPVVDVEQIDAGQKDFSSTIDKLKDANPQVVICSCFTEEAGLLGRQMNEKKLDVDYYGWDTLTSPDFLHIMGSDKTGKVVMIDYGRPPMNDLYKAFLAALEKKKWPVETTTVISYAAVKVLIDAIKFDNKLDTKMAAETLHAKEFDTILGKVKFDKYGDRVQPDFGIYRWVDGILKNTGNISYSSDAQ